MNQGCSLSVVQLLIWAAISFLAIGLQPCAKIDNLDRYVNNYNYSARMMAVGVSTPPENAMVSNTIVEDREASSEQNQTAIPQPKPFVAEGELFAPVPAVGREPSSRCQTKERMA
jgi:hypothetical protein